MGDLRRALIGFAKAYLVAVAGSGLLAYGVTRVASLDPIAFWQLLLAFLGVGYVFASVLAWTGFARIYRYSPNLFFGSVSYRRSVLRGEMAAEGRDSEALAIGVLFGLALVGTAAAFFGWQEAAIVVGAAAAITVYLRYRESAPPA